MKCKCILCNTSLLLGSPELIKEFFPGNYYKMIPNVAPDHTWEILEEEKETRLAICKYCYETHKIKENPNILYALIP